MANDLRVLPIYPVTQVWKIAKMAWHHASMDISWDEVKLFLAVAEEGSVSGAARKLRMAQPTLSRRLATLERAVGESLFRRSAAGAALTSAGERLLTPARRMAEWAGEVGRAAEPTDRGPQGLVRITAPPLVAHDFLAPFAAWLAGHHPGLRLEVLASMQHLDLARGEADLALRIRPPNQPDLKLVYTLETANAVHVAPALAKRLPRRPRLQDLPWIAWAPPYQELPPNPQLAELIPGYTPAFSADEILVQLAAAEAGVGAMVLPRLRHRFSRPSALVPLDIDLGPFARGAMHLVAARSALDIPRIRLLAQLIETELRKVVRT
jgi:DNA-binding transcriptional LysR family regulator